MKTIFAALAAVTLLAANASAADNTATNVFEQQVRYGENTAGPTSQKTTLEIFGIHGGE